jgi:hypothetical protein
MVALTFPDGARREYRDNSTGLDVARIERSEMRGRPRMS